MEGLPIQESAVTVTGLLTALCFYMLKKRDKVIDDQGAKTELAFKEIARVELLMAREYATKDSLRLLFQETQNTNRDTAVRLEKQIDETKSEIKLTNSKIDNMQTVIMTELRQKT